MKLKCELFASSDVEHLQQIYAGYSLLHKRGFLSLSQTLQRESFQGKNESNRWVDYKFFNVKVIVNEKIIVYYDLHDWNWIDEDILRGADFYFKRSYDENYVSQLAERAKVYRLGLNYPVSSSETDFFKLQRSQFYGGKKKVKAIIKSLRIVEMFGKQGETEQICHLEALPAFDLEPKIIFMAKAWDVERIEAKKQKEVTEEINETRADCVRVLRKEFGDRFFGGLARDEYSVKHFKDVLLPNEQLSNKRKYLDILKSFPICVATTGLNGSNGWKLGEYVALSKTIISEPLIYQATGDFAAERNYLEFRKSEELVDAATRLFEDKNLRYALMMNNFRYYRAYLRPDALILNSLAVVFSKSQVS